MFSETLKNKKNKKKQNNTSTFRGKGSIKNSNYTTTFTILSQQILTGFGNF